MRTRLEQAEWLINRALADGDNRKMKRALNASLKIRQYNRDAVQADLVRHQLRHLVRNMRKYRAWKAKEHPTQKISVSITLKD